MNVITKTYVFAQNINNTGETGIIEIYSGKLICFCNVENSKLILSALESHEELDTIKNQLDTLIGLKTQEISCSDTEISSTEQ